MHCWKRYAWNVAMLQMICLASGIGANAQNATGEAPNRLVFSATSSAKGIVYKIDGVIVSDPLRGFGNAIEKYGDDLPVICLIDGRLPILVIGNAVSTAEKVGFKHVRSFVVDHNTGKVSEAKFGPWTSAPNQ
jgi:hypothetical protein